MMPQHVGVGVKFAAELLAIGLRMTMQIHAGFFIISIDMVNAFNEIKRAAMLDAHNRHITLKREVPFWTEGLPPNSGQERTTWSITRALCRGPRNRHRVSPSQSTAR